MDTKEIGLGLLIQGGMVLLASTVWADLGRSTIESVYEHNKDASLRAKLIYTVVVTIFILIVIFAIQRTTEQFVGGLPMIGNWTLFPDNVPKGQLHM